MTRNTDGDRTDSTRRVAVVLGSALIAILLCVGAASGPALAQNQSDNESAPYYEDWDTNVQNETWMEGNEDATVENTTTMFSRLTTFVIGSDGEGGSSTALLSGAVVMGIFLGIGMSAGIGIIAGAVLSVATIFGATGLGILPEWLYPVALIGIGIMLSAMVKRQLQ